jgi:hypothetical protein
MKTVIVFLATMLSVAGVVATTARPITRGEDERSNAPQSRASSTPTPRKALRPFRSHDELKNILRNMIEAERKAQRARSAIRVGGALLAPRDRIERRGGSEFNHQRAARWC